MQLYQRLSLVTHTIRLLHVSHHLASTALLQTLLEQVCIYQYHMWQSLLIKSDLAVKIWDTIGEDQSVKGEYKVLSGKV
jgi:hypothetical protein